MRFVTIGGGLGGGPWKCLHRLSGVRAKQVSEMLPYRP